jgi:hypothetical protein
MCFWPSSAPPGRSLETGWGDSARPLDAPVPVAGGQLTRRDNELPVAEFAVLTDAWLHAQLARPLELHRWNRPAASRIVLADTGDVLARRGLRLRRTGPDAVERLSQR